MPARATRATTRASRTSSTWTHRGTRPATEWGSVAAETVPGSVDSVSALTRAAALVAEALPEERLVGLFARTASEVVAADFVALYLAPEQATAPGKRPWRLTASDG